jgi:hypothetical protein
MEDPKLRYYARLNPQKADEAFLNRPEVLRMDELGERLGFATSVLHQRGLFGPNEPLSAGGPRHPLLTWPFLDYLESLDLSAEQLIELGAGHSTLWFGVRFGRVRSFETDPQWHAALASRLGAGVELTLLAQAALEDADFGYAGEGFLLVDFAGRRTRCIKRFFERLGHDAARPKAVILDNADWYRRGAELLGRLGYVELPFYGFKAGQTWISCTSLFIDPARFALKPRAPFFRPAFSRAVENVWDELDDESSDQASRPRKP